MTTQEAREFLVRNPMVERLFSRITPDDLHKFEPVWNSEGNVRVADDRSTNLIDVYKALRLS